MLSASLIQSFLPALLSLSLAVFICLSFSLYFPASVGFSCTLSVCLSVSLPGVARVKLTRPDKDNSLTHSVVYFSPLLFPLFHSIPMSSLTPLSSILPFNRVSWSFHFDCFYPSVLPLPFSPLAGNLFYPVISSSCCLLFHSCLPSSISPSICLSGCLFIYVCLSSNQSVFLCLHTSLYVCPLLSPSQPFQPSLHPSPSVPVPN